MLDTRSSVSGAQYFFTSVYCVWRFCDTSSIDTLCCILKFKKLYRHIFRGFGVSLGFFLGGWRGGGGVSLLFLYLHIT